MVDITAKGNQHAICKHGENQGKVKEKRKKAQEDIKEHGSPQGYGFESKLIKLLYYCYNNIARFYHKLSTTVSLVSGSRTRAETSPLDSVCSKKIDRIQ